MASQSRATCEIKVIPLPEQFDSSKACVAFRSVIRLMTLKLQTTLADFGSEQIKGVAKWNDQTCVATDRFLIFYDDEDSYDEAADFKHAGDAALPPEIDHVVAIAAGSNSESLYILSHWIWTLSKKRKLQRWFEAPNVSSISVSDNGAVLLAENRGIRTGMLKLYDKTGALLRTFVMPHAYNGMKICQVEITGADSIVVSICGRRKSRVLLMNMEGVVERMYNSSTWNTQPTGDPSVQANCTIHSQFIALGKGGRLFVAETYPGNSNSLCQICKEKILVLGKHFETDQIILPDTRLQFKDYSIICCSGDKLFVACMMTSSKEERNSKEHNEVLTPVVNVYKVEHSIDSETEDESESDDDH